MSQTSRWLTAQINRWLSHKKIVCLILGALSVKALPPFDFLPILFLSLSALLLILEQAQNKREAFSWGYWFGFGYFACNMSWIGNALLIDAEKLGGLYPLVLLAAGGFFGLFTAFPALFSHINKSFYGRWLSFAAWWCIFEWIRSFIFTGFPWNLSGSVLSFNDELIQAASIFGTYGLSLLVIMATSAPALYIHYRNKKSLIISISSIVLIFAGLYGYGSLRLAQQNTQESDIRIRIVQPAIPQEMKWARSALEKNFNKYISMSQSSGLDKIDFVIWGETATPFPLDFEPEYTKQITQAIPEKGYLITGLVRHSLEEDGFHPRNSMYILNKKGEIINFYDKSHLVPFGEYIPFRKQLPQWISPVTNTISDFMAGSGNKTIKIDGYPSFAGLICYEIIFPHQIINQDQSPEWLINLTNDGWYGISQGPFQHFVSTRLRAVEEGKTIIRAANTGISALINPYGEVLAKADLNEEKVIDINLPQQLSITTPYGTYGNIIPLILCLLNICFAFSIKNKITPNN